MLFGGRVHTVRATDMNAVAAEKHSTAPAPDDDRRLLTAARAGDPDAREQVVKRNLGLVMAVAARYRGLGLPAEDLVQEGSIGLLEALDDFDETREAAFRTYAFWHIRRAMTRALTNAGRLVRLPRHVVERRRAVMRAWARLAMEQGRVPSVDEITAATGFTVAVVEQALTLPSPLISLDETVGDGGWTMGTVLADVAALDPEDEALAGLSDRKRAVIAAHFGLDGDERSLQQVGAELHLSAQRARELEQEALFELEATLRSGPKAGVAGRSREAAFVPAQSRRRRKEGGAAAADVSAVPRGTRRSARLRLSRNTDPRGTRWRAGS